MSPSVSGGSDCAFRRSLRSFLCDANQGRGKRVTQRERTRERARVEIKRALIGWTDSNITDLVSITKSSQSGCWLDQGANKPHARRTGQIDRWHTCVHACSLATLQYSIFCLLTNPCPPQRPPSIRPMRPHGRHRPHTQDQTDTHHRRHLAPLYTF